MNKLTNRTYKPTSNPNPIWQVDQCITYRIYEFDAVNPNDGQILGKTRLYWRRNTKDTISSPLYRGCSYRFTGYNPIPVTDWFHGVPMNQMFKWCASHNLVNMRCVSEYKDITYVDTCIYDPHSGEWYKP